MNAARVCTGRYEQCVLNLTIVALSTKSGYGWFHLSAASGLITATSCHLSLDTRWYMPLLSSPTLLKHQHVILSFFIAPPRPISIQTDTLPAPNPCSWLET